MKKNKINVDLLLKNERSTIDRFDMHTSTEKRTTVVDLKTRLNRTPAREPNCADGDLLTTSLKKAKSANSPFDNSKKWSQSHQGATK